MKKLLPFVAEETHISVQKLQSEMLAAQAC